MGSLEIACLQIALPGAILFLIPLLEPLPKSPATPPDYLCILEAKPFIAQINTVLITLDIPEELATQLQPLEKQLPRILE